VFCTWSVPRYYEQETRLDVSQLSVESQSVKRRRSSVRREQPFTIQRGLEPEGRGITIIGASSRQLLMKTLQSGKDLVCTVVICRKSL
jgi:hypothetical protein